MVIRVMTERRPINVYKLVWIIIVVVLLLLNVYSFAHLKEVWRDPLSKMIQYNNPQNPLDFQMSIEGIPAQKNQLHVGLWVSLILCGYYLFKLNFISVYLQGLYHKFNFGYMIAGYLYEHIWGKFFVQNPNVAAFFEGGKYPFIALILYGITLFIVYWLYAAIPMAVCGLWNGMIFPTLLWVIKKIHPERGRYYAEYHLLGRRNISYEHYSAQNTKKAASNNTASYTPVSIKKQEDPFRRLVGVDEAVNSLKKELEIPLKYPEKAKKFGVRPVKGILLYGPPGCGKTSIARAAASYFNCTFYSIKAGDIMSKWVGETEQNIKNLFAEARAKAPSIIFIDEIDHIGRRRDGGDMNRPR